MIVGSWRCRPPAGSFEYFALLLLQGFHGDRMGWAPLGAQRAADAFLFVLDNRAGLARRQFACRNAEPFRDQGLVAGVSLDLHQIHQAETVLRADVHAAIAEDALRAVEDGIDLTLQTAQSLGTALGLVETHFDFGNADPAIRWQHRHFLAGRAQESARHLPVAEDAEPAQHRFLGLAIEVDVNGAGGAMPVGHAPHEHARSEGHIAAGENSGSRGHQVLIDLQGSARRDLDRFVAAEEGEVRLLADGQDHAMALDQLLVVAEGRIEAAVFVKDGDAAADLPAGDDAVLSDDLFRPPTVLDDDAFLLRLVDLAFPRRHLPAGFQAHQAHLFGAGTQRHAGRVQGGLQAFGAGFGGAGVP